MSIKIGNNNLSIKIGNNIVSRVYIGSTLIYSIDQNIIINPYTFEKDIIYSWFN